MKKSRLIGMCALLLLTAMPVTAQQIIYGSAKALAGGKGDTVTTLHVERRTRNQLYLMGGADYRIESSTNQSLSRYLRKRCYAVRIDSTLYVNCRKMRYKRYRLGGWYAPALERMGRIFYAAQPVGQAATKTLTPVYTQKLRGEVGDAIQASGLVDKRVYYELDVETGRSYFVDKERMRELLSERPDLLQEFEKEISEAAEVMVKYLLRLE